jgi:hypothetical protein
LFAARDVWFVVSVPIFLARVLGWSLWSALVLAGLAGIGAMFLPPVTADVDWSGAKGDD